MRRLSARRSLGVPRILEPNLGDPWNSGTSNRFPTFPGLTSATILQWIRRPRSSFRISLRCELLLGPGLQGDIQLDAHNPTHRAGDIARIELTADHGMQAYTARVFARIADKKIGLVAVGPKVDLAD
jgi:hypothetical protein